MDTSPQPAYDAAVNSSEQDIQALDQQAQYSGSAPQFGNMVGLAMTMNRATTSWTQRDGAMSSAELQSQAAEARGWSAAGVDFFGAELRRGDAPWR